MLHLNAIDVKTAPYQIDRCVFAHFNVFIMAGGQMEAATYRNLSSLSHI